MDDIVFSHEVQRDQYLNGETFDKAEAEALKVVHFDEVVQIDTQQFECDHQMLSKYKLVQHFNNVFLIFWVFLI